MPPVWHTRTRSIPRAVGVRVAMDPARSGQGRSCWRLLRTVGHSAVSGLWEHPKFRFIFSSRPIDIERVIEAPQMRSTAVCGVTPSEPTQSLRARTIVHGPG